jgi:hypothetical protein
MIHAYCISVSFQSNGERRSPNSAKVQDISSFQEKIQRFATTIISLTRQEVGKVPIQRGTSCQWFLLRFGDEFGVQYTGPDPEQNLGDHVSGLPFLFSSANE